MPITTLTPDAQNASKAAALLAAQVKKDLLGTREFTQTEAVQAASHIVAALIESASNNQNQLNILPSRLGR